MVEIEPSVMQLCNIGWDLFDTARGSRTVNQEEPWPGLPFASHSWPSESRLRRSRWHMPPIISTEYGHHGSDPHRRDVASSVPTLNRDQRLRLDRVSELHRSGCGSSDPQQRRACHCYGLICREIEVGRSTYPFRRERLLLNAGVIKTIP